MLKVSVLLGEALCRSVLSFVSPADRDEAAKEGWPDPSTRLNFGIKIERTTQLFSKMISAVIGSICEASPLMLHPFINPAARAQLEFGGGRPLVSVTNDAGVTLSY